MWARTAYIQLKIPNKGIHRRIDMNAYAPCERVVCLSIGKDIFVISPCLVAVLCVCVHCHEWILRPYEPIALGSISYSSAASKHILCSTHITCAMYVFHVGNALRCSHPQSHALVIMNLYRFIPESNFLFLRSTAKSQYCHLSCLAADSISTRSIHVALLHYHRLSAAAAVFPCIDMKWAIPFTCMHKHIETIVLVWF